MTTITLPEAPAILIRPLSDFLDEYIGQRTLQPISIQELKRTVHLFGRWLERAADVADLNTATLNAWLDYRSASRAANTVGRNKRELVSLWNAAANDDLLPPPKKLRKVPRQLAAPQAWTADEVKMLLKATHHFHGRFNSPSCAVRRDFFRALILAAWDTGLRRCDLLALRFSQIGRDGTLVLLQRKTDWPVVCRFKPATLKAIDLICTGDDDPIFGGVVESRALTRYGCRLVRLAGVKRGPLMRWMRRSSATAVELVQPGSAMAHLGHKTPGLAYKHYVDPAQVQRAKIATPDVA